MRGLGLQMEMRIKHQFDDYRRPRGWKLLEPKPMGHPSQPQHCMPTV